MFKSKYTIFLILLLILISIVNIFSIIYVEYNTVSLVKFKEHRIECGKLLDILKNNIDYSNSSLLSMNRTSCRQIAIVTLFSSIISIIFLSLFLYLIIKYISNRKDVEDLNDLLMILKKRNNK